MAFDAQLGDHFLSHYKTLRGVVRHALVARQLDAHLSGPPGAVVDVGGGAGRQGIRLARKGYAVTILDPSTDMLARAQEALASEPDGVRERVELVLGKGEEAPETLGGAEFDAVLCHGVLMYVDQPSTLVSALAALARPRAIVSILTKNAGALAMRPALEGRYREALAAFDAQHDVGRLGVSTTAHTVAELSNFLRDAGMEIACWYGVRLFTDHLGDRPPDPASLADVIQAEWEAGRHDPYRALARLLHVVGSRR